MKLKKTLENTKNNPLDGLKSLVSKDLEQVDSLIFGIIENKIDLIPEISGHTISAGGKRLRPVLTLACAKMCRYDGTSHIDLAASVEFIHTATLLHDDVVDKSDLRRGESTANNLWGNKESILVGDFLLGKAFHLMGAAKSLEIYRILSNAAVVISEGEVFQLAMTGNLESTKSDYVQIISSKTAELFAAACQIAPVLAGKPDEQSFALREFGLNLGIAFQIVDDALDYRADTAVLGKKIGDDFRDRKVTLPVFQAYENASQDEQEFWQRTIGRGEIADGDFETALKIMEDRFIFDSCINEAKSYIEQAQGALNLFKDSEIKELLIGILGFVVARQS